MHMQSGPQSLSLVFLAQDQRERIVDGDQRSSSEEAEADRWWLKRISRHTYGMQTSGEEKC
eukprot:m.164879 g.164879  ORF g.164879 m.164879 type:complete len:61 (+) comp16418_c0_seq6:1172-1354(+)